jgi:hypothetical protein
MTLAAGVTEAWPSLRAFVEITTTEDFLKIGDNEMWNLGGTASFVLTKICPKKLGLT